MRKIYIIRNKFFPKENLGRLMLDLDTEESEIYPLSSYEGLHSVFLLDYYASKGITKDSGAILSLWLSERVCPPGRHNISEVIEKTGIERYSVNRLIDYNKGHSMKDNLWFEEIEIIS